MNLYVYAGNDPINAADPSGMDDEGDGDSGDDTPTINVTDNIDHDDVSTSINGTTAGGTVVASIGKQYYTGSRIGLILGQLPTDTVYGPGIALTNSQQQQMVAAAIYTLLSANSAVNLVLISSDPFHDAVAQYIANSINATGGVAALDVPITSIGSNVTAVPDVLAMSPTNFFFAVEVKTGQNPSFTYNQSYVYPLMDLGNHVYSSDPRISEFGYAPGQPLPPICVYAAYARAPGSQIQPSTISASAACSP